MNSALNLRFTEDDWCRVDAAWQRWWAGDLERPLVMIEARESWPRWEATRPFEFASNYPLDMPAGDVIALYGADLEDKFYLGDAWPKWWPNFGPGIVAGFLGAPVHSTLNTVWFEKLPAAGLPEIHPAHDPANPWWRRVLDLTRAAVAAWGDLVSAGHSDLGGVLDIPASLRGTQDLLVDLYDAPDEVERLAREITGLWLRYYDELAEAILPAGRGTTPWAGIRSAGRCYMLQCDFAFMISSAMFERFVLPTIDTWCAALDHAVYHLDGRGQLRHLDMLMSLDRMHGIQWVPGDGSPPPEDWPEVLRRIRAAGKLCQLNIDAVGALKIVREMGGRGFAFWIKDRMTPEEGRAFLRELERA